jgi:hypothetical protein
MAFGLQIWNSSAQNTLTVSDSLTKYVGIITLSNNAANGSQTFADLAGGRPFAEVLRTTTDPTMYLTPIVTFSGTTATWTFPNTGAGTASRAACKIVLGTY